MSANVAVSTPIPKPSKKRVAQHKSTVQKLTEAKLPQEYQLEDSATMEPELGRKVDRQDELSPLASKSDRTCPPVAAPGLQSKATAAKKRSAPVRSSSTKKLKMVDQGTQTQTLSGCDHTTALLPLSNNQTSASVARKECPTPPPHSYLDLLDAFVTRYQSGPAPKNLWNRPGYTEADEEQRQQILNEFICENLDNPEFIHLCEDTEKAWRRMGLGM
jgi:hypothetical protein